MIIVEGPVCEVSFSVKLEVGEVAAGFTGKPDAVEEEEAGVASGLDVKGFKLKGDVFFCLDLALATAAAAAAAAYSSSLTRDVEEN